MSFASGTFLINSTGQPVVTGTVISSTAFNALTADLATGLSTCILKDGTQTIVANLPMAGFKFTGLGAGTAATDSANLSQAQSQQGSTLTAVSGTNTILGTATPTPAYAIGQKWTFVAAATNTGATTLNISGLGAGAVQLAGAALTGGEILINTAITVVTTAATPVFEIIAMLQFPDTRALIVGGTDSTKKVRFEVDGLTTGTTRVITLPDADISIVQGTFTASLTGCTSVPTGSAVYSITNNVVTLFLPGLTGTSNTTACTVTGLPAAITPTTTHSGFSAVTTDNSANGSGTINVRSDNTIQLQVSPASAVFTNTGTKGLSAGVTVTYNLN